MNHIQHKKIIKLNEVGQGSVKPRAVKSYIFFNHN